VDDKLANELRVTRLAARQHGVVSVAQLAAHGVSKDAITARLRRGRLHRVHRGVYAVGHAGLGHEGRWMAAVLACGPSAVLSHRSAGELWGLLEPKSGAIEITIRSASGRRRNGLRIHRSPDLPKTATTTRSGIAVTTPQRTLEDLRTTIEAGGLRRAIRQAEIAGLPIDAEAVIGDRAASELELRFLALCRRHRLPAPEVNVRVDRFLVDFLWRRGRLIVETDGARFHRGALARAEDAARDRTLRASGYVVIRFTYRDVVDQPRRVAAAVRDQLASRGDRDG
jgi:very-short-patch-repair endonuclease